MLKAIVTEITGKLPPKIHDLKRLMYLARIRRPPGHIAKFIGRLSGASVFTRYPESLEEMVAAYPKEIAQKYLSETREVLEWLEDSPKLKK